MARRAWSEVEEETLLQYLTSLVDEGVWQSDFGFRPSYSEVLKNMMQAFFPGCGITKMHIERKIRDWKRDFVYINKFRQMEGFGWDDYEKKLVVENEQVWNNFVQGHPRFANWNGKRFPNYSRWSYCFTPQASGENED